MTRETEGMAGFLIPRWRSRQNWVLAKCGSDSKASACNAGDPGSIPGLGRSLEKEMATHSCILAWRIPWTEEPGGLQSMGLKESDTTERPSLSQLYLLCLLTLHKLCPQTQAHHHHNQGRRVATHRVKLCRGLRKDAPSTHTAKLAKNTRQGLVRC